MCLSVGVQRGSRAHDDGYNVRDGHSGKCGDPDAAQLVGRNCFVLEQRLVVAGIFQFFDLLRTLPEKQIRADRRTENSNNNRKAVAIQRNGWPEETFQGGDPVHMRYKQHRNIRKKHKRDPFE